MKNVHQFGVEELSLTEKRTVEGGAFNFEPMHIHLLQVPEIREWNPKIDFNKAIIWS